MTKEKRTQSESPPGAPPSLSILHSVGVVVLAVLGMLVAVTLFLGLWHWFVVRDATPGIPQQESQELKDLREVKETLEGLTQPARERREAGAAGHGATSDDSSP